MDNIMKSEEKIDRLLERKEKKEYKVKKEQQEEKYEDLPAHILNKLYR